MEVLGSDLRAVEDHSVLEVDANGKKLGAHGADES
jgi:hypothetical protein